eukprot:6197212-Pleurochrysis_carterae.AAC.1
MLPPQVREELVKAKRAVKALLVEGERALFNGVDLRAAGLTSKKEQRAQARRDRAVLMNSACSVLLWGEGGGTNYIQAGAEGAGASRSCCTDELSLLCLALGGGGWH